MLTTILEYILNAFFHTKPKNKCSFIELKGEAGHAALLCFHALFFLSVEEVRRTLPFHLV